jgi:hypothetical protein
MNRLIRTPSGSLIQIIPQIDIQLLLATHIPRTRIRPAHACNRPREPVALPRKFPVRVLCLRERYAQAVVVNVPRLADHGVEKLCGGAGRGHELHELSVDDLELARRRVVAEKRGAGAVQRAGLHVFVEVGRCNGADPVVPTLESGAGAAAGRCACRGGLAGLGLFGLRGGGGFGVRLGLGGGSAGLALGIVVAGGSSDMLEGGRSVDVLNLDTAGVSSACCCSSPAHSTAWSCVSGCDDHIL